MIHPRLRPTASKYGGGISLLWRGTSPKEVRASLASAFSSGPDRPDAADVNCFLFESARSALFNALSALEVGVGDEVVLSAFTCSAVSFAVSHTRATIVYADIKNDLTMDDDSVLAGLTPRTKAVVMQSTFGRLGLKTETLATLKHRGIAVIEDCSLSIGSSVDGRPHGTFGDLSIWSLEVSKTLTIGWGGVLTVNSPGLLSRVSERYGYLRPVPVWLDLRRVTQLYVSASLVTIPVPIGILLWYFFYGTRIFRGSNGYKTKYLLDYARLGPFSRILFDSMQKKSQILFKRSNTHYTTLLRKAKELGLDCPVAQNADEMIVTPRFPLLIDEAKIELLQAHAEAAHIEVGRWFDQAPPSYGIESARAAALTNAKRICRTIVNLPCHWSLSDREISSLLQLMEKMAAA